MVTWAGALGVLDRGALSSLVNARSKAEQGRVTVSLGAAVAKPWLKHYLVGSVPFGRNGTYSAITKEAQPPITDRFTSTIRRERREGQVWDVPLASYAPLRLNPCSCKLAGCVCSN